MSTITKPLASFDYRVYFEDTDAGGVVYHANYLQYMERARSDWLRSLGYDHQRLAAEWQMGFVVKDLSIDFRSPAMLDDLLRTSVELIALHRTRLVLRQTLGRVDQDKATSTLHTCASANLTIVLVRSVIQDGITQLKPCKMPEVLYDDVIRSSEAK